MATNTLWVSQFGAQVEYVDGQDELKSIKVSQFGAQVEHVGGGGEVPRINVSQYGAQVEHVGGLDTLQALKLSQLGIQVEYREAPPGGSLDEYAPRILVEFMFGGNPNFSTQDLYVDDAGDLFFYEKRVFDSPEVERELANMYYGREDVGNITVKLDNADGYFTTFCGSYELRNQKVRIRRYNPGEPIGANIIQFEMLGLISSYKLMPDYLEIELTMQDPDKLQTLLPKKVYETDDYTETPPNIINPSDDLGKPINICFGKCYQVPCLYIHADYTNDYYDYLIGYGNIESVDKVYRDGIEVNAAEYTAYTGTQGSPYPGYAFIRFVKEQRSFSGAMHQISSDIKGLLLGEATAQRNFVYCIKSVLQDAAFGLGEPVDDTVFASEAAKITDLYCDGFISEQRRAIEILDDLLLAARGRLDKDENGSWFIEVDSSESSTQGTFGHEDGYWNNILSINNYEKTPISEAIKTVYLNYRWNNLENKYSMQNTRSVLAFGQDMTLSNPFIYEHATADRVTCYLEQLLEYTDTKLEIEVGMEGRLLQLRNVITVKIPVLNINGDYQIRGIRRHINKFVLSLVSYNVGIFTYNAGTLPSDANDPAKPDYKVDTAPTYAAPTAPTGFEFVSSYVVVAGDGSAWVYATAKAIAPDDQKNFQSIVFGYREINSADYTWVPGTLYNSVTREWRASGCAPASGRVTKIYYDVVSKSVNVYGRESTYGGSANSTLNTMAPCDTVNPLPITGVSGYGFGKTWYYSWVPSTARDIHQYRIQVGSSNFSTIYATAIVGSNNYAYTNEALPYGELSARVVAVDRSENESSVWSNVATALTITMLATDISNGVVSSLLIADGAVNSSKLGATCVITAKIDSCAVTAPKIATNILTSAHFTASCVDNANIKLGSINETKINFTSSNATSVLPAAPSGYVTIDGKKFYYYT